MQVQYHSDGRSAGHGVVIYETIEDAEKALVGTNGYRLEGRTIEVRLAADRQAGRQAARSLVSSHLVFAAVPGMQSCLPCAGSARCCPEAVRVCLSCRVAGHSPAPEEAAVKAGALEEQDQAPAPVW